jgi:nucleotide-binding universal stress UspA family protein
MSTAQTTRTILVPLDGSDASLAALPWVRTLATPETRLVLHRVVTMSLALTELAGVAAETYEAVSERDVEAAMAYLKEVSADLAGVIPHITELARIGNPADDILEVATIHHVDLILMATHGRGAAGRFFIGSVADRVARAATVPVMLVHTADDGAMPTIDAPAMCRRILVPLDGSELARAAVPVAVDLARQLAVPVHLLRVVPTREAMYADRDAHTTGRLYQRAVRALPTLPRDTGDEPYYQDYVDSRKRALAAEASRLEATGVQATPELRLGQTVPSIAEVVSAGDVIVMTSHGQGGIRRWLLGSVAEKLLHLAIAPVVLVPALGREHASAPEAPERPDILEE